MIACRHLVRRAPDFCDRCSLSEPAVMSRAHSLCSKTLARTCLHRFAELSTLLDPCHSNRSDKHSTVSDAIRAVTDLRLEQQRLQSLVARLEVSANPLGLVNFQA